MAYTEDTILGDLLDDPKARDVLAKHFPHMKDAGPMLAMARGMSLKKVAQFPQANISPEKLKAVVDDLAKL